MLNKDVTYLICRTTYQLPYALCRVCGNFALTYTCKSRVVECICGVATTVRWFASLRSSSVDVWSSCRWRHSTVFLNWSEIPTANSSSCSTQLDAAPLYWRR